mmetsp:Transcript_28505/g.65196  ORF Transcript_28505/g.65196 Transcript_28505/m.65196 type:complete len:89 (+) Transcript_28505:229-495(+)
MPWNHQCWQRKSDHPDPPIDRVMAIRTSSPLRSTYKTTRAETPSLSNDDSRGSQISPPFFLTRLLSSVSDSLCGRVSKITLESVVLGS